ncbi:hypothetical protein COU57_03290 [Candidatus Pacearchaeota archaeon CG10_big_fil_rev_8_21_14_0_10_32_14]|nr:MAG: hypothetical protein COU57_03290 [Candidatus Pacearchaeota archaeon CG10_big_fil_rev_8_21_14_0_10_32_14]
MEWYTKSALSLVSALSLGFSNLAYSQRSNPNSLSKSVHTYTHQTSQSQKRDSQILRENLENKLSNVKDHEGNAWFEEYDCEEFIENKIPFSYIETCSLYSNEKGDPVYFPFEINRLWREEISEDFIDRLLSEFSLRNHKIPSVLGMIRYSQLCKDPKDFFPEDTKRPNALILLPEEGIKYNDKFKSAFYSQDSIKFYSRIQDGYDVALRVYDSTQELCDSLLESVENNFSPDLFLLGGHGSQSGYIALSDKKLFLEVIIGSDGLKLVPGENADKFLLNFDDRTGEYFSLLPPSSTFFLFSCYGGKSFMEFINEYSPRTRFIGGSKPFSVTDVYIDRLYPFDARIVNPTEELTVTNQPFFGSKSIITYNDPKYNEKIDDLLRPEFPR